MWETARFWSQSPRTTLWLDLTQTETKKYFWTG